MKHYKVLKEMINAPVGTILYQGNTDFITNKDNNIIFYFNQIETAIDQGFIEPYTPEPKRWKAGFNQKFFYLDELSEVCSLKDPYDIVYYDLCNHFKSQATAELVAKAQKLLFEWLHDTESEKLGYNFEDKNDKSVSLVAIFDEARKAVLEDDSNERS